MPTDANLVLVVGAVIAGAVVIDYGTKAVKGAFASTPTVSDSTASGITGSQPTTGPAGAEKMLAAATAASAANIPYSQSVQTSGLLAGFRSDCSGFVSWVVSQAIPGFGDQDTVTMASDPNLVAGRGTYVTLWDRAQPGDAGHVIIEILGRWFESGGGTNTSPGGGPAEISAAAAAQEISNGMSPYHPQGL